LAVPFHSSFARQASTPKTLILAIRKIQRHLQATSSASHEGQNRFEPGRWSILALGSRTILEIGSDRFRLFGFQRELRPRGGPVRLLSEPLAAARSGHHRVPITAKIGRHTRHSAAMMTDLARRPPTRPISDPSAFSGDPLVCLDEGNNVTVRVRATPPRLRPKQSGWPSKPRQIDEFDLEVVVMPHRARTSRTGHSGRLNQPVTGSRGSPSIGRRKPWPGYLSW
jgi:hypothetical protein